MRFFRRVMNRVFGRRDLAPPESAPHVIYDPGNPDASFEANRDVLRGVSYNPPLDLRSTLFQLEHYGEIFEGPPGKAPRYGDDSRALWVPVTKSWEELAGRELSGSAPSKDPKRRARYEKGLRRAGFTPEQISRTVEGGVASDVGQVLPEEYLPFLKEFRRIVEGEGTSAEKIARLKRLPTRNDEFRRFWEIHDAGTGTFPRAYFCSELARVPGIGWKTAIALYDHGYATLEDLFSASDAELLATPGVGRKTVAAIRAFKPGR